MLVICLLLLTCCGLSSTKLKYDKIGRYLIACHTTDFECFQRQYISLRDNFLFGNDRLSIPEYEDFVFEYDSNTCVKLSGFDESELVGISMASKPKKITMNLQLPLRIQHVRNHGSSQCAKPDRGFEGVKHHKGPFMRFTGNDEEELFLNMLERHSTPKRKLATIYVSYSFELRKKKGKTYMKLQDEDLDMVLDIADLRHFDLANKVEVKLYAWSEWAYEVVQHVDAAQRFALPYTSRMRAVMDKVPLNKFLLLYPEEDYDDVHFNYETNIK